MQIFIVFLNVIRIRIGLNAESDPVIWHKCESGTGFVITLFSLHLSLLSNTMFLNLIFYKEKKV